jgi:membrane protein implicated in regulation of membrane protease activity
MWQEPYLWWAAFGFVLLIVEMVTGTFFFLAIAVAAFITTFAAWLTPDMLTQWVCFSVAGILSIVLWQQLRHKHKTNTHDAASKLNNRLAHLINRQAVLLEPITNGVGRINIDDSWWKVTGEDLPVGTPVHVTAIHDMTLTVEKNA